MRPNRVFVLELAVPAEDENAVLDVHVDRVTWPQASTGAE